MRLDKDELTQIVKAVRDAMELVVPGPMRVMRWIEQEVSNAIKEGAEEYHGQHHQVLGSIKDL